MSQVANTIHQQIGGNQLNAMIGVKSLVGGDDRLTIHWKARSPFNCVRIVLNESDLYDVRFYKIKGAAIQKQKDFTGVYCDRLRGLFEEVTKLATSLTQSYASH
jgi:hypothetical protein